jgi:hypothetical protein
MMIRANSDAEQRGIISNGVKLQNDKQNISFEFLNYTDGGIWRKGIRASGTQGCSQ